MDYWAECISEAFDEVEIKATKEQIEYVAGCVEGAHENYSLATGEDIVNANFKSEAQIELERLKMEIEREENFKNSTEPCEGCYTTGTVQDRWGRNATCENCNGKGRI